MKKLVLLLAISVGVAVNTANAQHYRHYHHYHHHYYHHDHYARRGGEVDVTVPLPRHGEIPHPPRPPMPPRP